jgi:hypothetical protein
LFGQRGVIKRELDVVERAQFTVVENGNAVAVGSDGELDRFRLQVRQYCLELGMHTVLTGAEIHRAHREPFHDCFHVMQGKTVNAAGIPIAERTREITFVCKPDPERNPSVVMDARARSLDCAIVHLASFITGPVRKRAKYQSVSRES